MTQEIAIQSTDTNSLVTISESGILLQAELSSLSFSREDNNLLISSTEGTQTTIKDFFVENETSSLPEFILQDGTVVSGVDLLTAQSTDIDISTGAGPSASNASSSGAGDYADNGGDLLGGIDRLGKLEGVAQWSGQLTSVTETSQELTLAGEIPTQDVGVTPIDPSTYHARLIIAAGSTSTDYTVMLQNADASAINLGDSVSVQFASGSAGYFVTPVTINPDGSITLALSPAGIAAQQSGVNFTDILIVSINNVEYPIQIMGNVSNVYDTQQGESTMPGPGSLVGEFYQVEGADLVQGTIHLNGDGHSEVTINNQSTGSIRGVTNSSIILSGSGTNLITIQTDSTNGSAYGTYTTDGETFIDSGTGDTEISVKGMTNSSGIFNSATGSSPTTAKTTITGENIAINTTVDGNNAAYGIYASKNSNSAYTSTVTVNAADSLEINATSVGSARGIYAQNNSTVNLSGKEVALSSESGTNTAYTAYAAAGATINIATDKEGSLTISSDVEHSTSSTMYNGVLSSSGIVSSQGGTNINVTTSDLTVTSNVADSSAKGTASAIYSGYGATATVNGYADVENNFSLNAKAANEAFGIIATNDGTFKMNGGNLNDTVHITAQSGSSTSGKNTGSSIGIYAQAGGKATLTGGAGNDSIIIDSTYSGLNTGLAPGIDAQYGAMGMVAAWGTATATIKGFENVTINADGGAHGAAYGMYSREAYDARASNNILADGSAITVTITATAGDGAKAFAMFANSGGNYIVGGSHAGQLHGDVITLNGHIATGQYGARNSVTTGAGNDTITLKGDMLINSNDSRNLLSTGEGDDSVSITGNLTARGYVGRNEIDTGTGNDTVHIDGNISALTNGTVSESSHNTIRMGDGSDELVITGNILAEGSSQGSTNYNLFDLGKGDDTLSITGDISVSGAGKNTILAGDGDDVIYLHGKIGNGALTLDAGDGYDILTLTADDFTSFKDFYGDWLLSDFANMNVESIHIDLGSLQGSDLADLQNYFADPIFDGANISFINENAVNIDHYTSDGGLGTFNLNDVLDELGSEETTTLDMTGSIANYLEIGQNLSGVSSELTINGSSNDTISLQNNWTTDGVVHDGYYTYVNESEQAVQVQQEITVILSS